MYAFLCKYFVLMLIANFRHCWHIQLIYEQCQRTIELHCWYDSTNRVIWRAEVIALCQFDEEHGGNHDFVGNLSCHFHKQEKSEKYMRAKSKKPRAIFIPACMTSCRLEMFHQNSNISQFNRRKYITAVRSESLSIGPLPKTGNRRYSFVWHPS